VGASAGHYDGLNLGDAYLPREGLVATLHRTLITEDKTFVHIGSPPATGKTSLLQLLKKSLRADGVLCVKANPKRGIPVSMVLKKATGLDTINFDVDPTVLHLHPNETCVVFMDDAQNGYGESEHQFWADLVKEDVPGEGWLPPNVKFVISATYSISTPDSPVLFSDMDKIVYPDMLLTRQEVENLFDIYCAEMEHRDKDFGALLRDRALRAAIAKSCNGHVGAITIALDRLADHAHAGNADTVEDMLKFVFSESFVKQFGRCFPFPRGTVLPAEVVNSLLLMTVPESVHESVTFTEERSERVWAALQRCGILILNNNDFFEFSCPLAQRFINRQMFPHRLGKRFVAQSPVELVKEALQKMSASALRSSVPYPMTDFPIEVVWQHHLWLGLQLATPAGTSIISELSGYFPPNEEVTSTQVAGRVDFHVNGNRGWAIEVLVNGAKYGEHKERFAKGGKYSDTAVRIKDHILLDIRSSKTGKATNVETDPHRVTVFFKLGDYSKCVVQYGHEDTVKTETIHLAP
jgi:hypothetical protein